MKTEKVDFETVETVATEPEVTVESDSAESERTVCAPEDAAVEKVIRESVYAAMGIGVVPLPLFNVAAVTASSLNLARRLSNLYGVEFKEGVARKIIVSVMGAGAGVLASPLVETAVIGIPLVGLGLAIGTKPVLNGTTTYAVGRMFVTHFERGGSFTGANVDAMKEDFKSALWNSREWLGNVIKGKKAVESA